MGLVKKIRRGWSREYFRKNFLLILFIAFIPGVISGIGINWFGVNELKNGLRERHDSQITEKAEIINDQLDYLEMSLSYWAFEKRFGPELIDRNFVKDVTETRDMMQMLRVLQASHPLIKKVELYLNKDNQPLLFSPFYSEVSAVDYSIYQPSLSRGYSLGWEQVDDRSNEGGTETTVLSHAIPGSSQEPFGSLNVTLDQEKFGQLLQTLKPYDHGTTFLINGQNETIPPAVPLEETHFVSALKNEVVQLDNQEGSFVFTYNGDSYSVSYGVFKRVNDTWTYVSAAPLSAITAPIELVSKSIMVISVTGLGLALVLTWFGSKKIYRPVEQLIERVQEEYQEVDSTKQKGEFSLIEEGFTHLFQERQRLKSRLNSETPQLQKSFLIQMSQGYLYQQNEQQLINRMENYGWKVNDKRFRVIDIQASGTEELNQSFITSDDSLITFSIQNVIEELCEKYFHQYSVLDNYDLSVSLFLIEEDSDSALIKDFIQEMTAIINRLLHMQLIITVSERTDQVKRIHTLFEETRQGKYQRRFKNQNQVLFLEEVQQRGTRSYGMYPFEVEREVIQAIRNGEKLQIQNHLQLFLNQLVAGAKTWENIQMGMLQLFSRIQHEMLHSDIHLEEVYANRNLYAELSLIKEPVRMLSWMEVEVIDPYLTHLNERVNLETKRLIESVIDYLKTSYMNDISLDHCAEMFGTNAHTLSRSFKKMTGVKFIDYLTELRIDKSKQLLSGTTMKIHEVAEQVGYRHSYFNRIFKKSASLSPSEYRKKYG
ncbi:helix-turn-helix domain-containing protein [Alkalicoccobacillus murimartini]|uniref:AraC-like DNA-binding protein/regulator of replication initiation timing n=1 Tax=Alkalicoccobacillus murimartini TaxID=171685 RepID=A0ABT9YIG8_9BACI|nr:helix-turn-helix domain-containing protein [Alkalicoccobacillus murimartini]MDQ0207655.1 AraC-like DNA-binding protein/regulator of replication initiation timing [Alkalicoccobacillus murimartini]